MPNNNNHNSTNIRMARKKNGRQLCDTRELCCEMALSSGRNAWWSSSQPTQPDGSSDSFN